MTDRIVFFDDLPDGFRLCNRCAGLTILATLCGICAALTDHDDEGLLRDDD